MNNAALSFTNFSNEDFTKSWDGKPWTFKAGQTVMLQDFLAMHFAKHLVDRELNKKNIPTNSIPERKKLMDMCLTDPGISAETPEKLASKIMNSDEPKEEVQQKELKPVKKLEDMNKTELVEYAGVMDLDVNGLNKSQIIKAIESKRGANPTEEVKHDATVLENTDNDTSGLDEEGFEGK